MCVWVCVYAFSSPFHILFIWWHIFLTPLRCKSHVSFRGGSRTYSSLCKCTFYTIFMCAAQRADRCFGIFFSAFCIFYFSLNFIYFFCMFLLASNHIHLHLFISLSFLLFSLPHIFSSILFTCICVACIYVCVFALVAFKKLQMGVGDFCVQSIKFKL